MREKIVLVTRKTQLEELIERFNTFAQAKFLLGQRGEAIDDYVQAHDRYRQSLASVQAAIPKGVRSQLIERSFLPGFLFGPNDLVITLGPDGLVVNTAKYLRDQPLLAFNPDPARMDGVLIPFDARSAHQVLPRVLQDQAPTEKITMAVARLDDGQALYAVNDLFIGQRTHVSARYRISFGEQTEQHSSSGIIVSTGAGSSGWYRSILAGAAGVAKGVRKKEKADWQTRFQFSRTADELKFCVREPFTSKVSQAELVYGTITPERVLTLASQMPTGGVIFSDGIESDFLSFESGRVATIAIADRKVNLVTREKRGRV